MSKTLNDGFVDDNFIFPSSQFEETAKPYSVESVFTGNMFGTFPGFGIFPGFGEPKSMPMYKAVPNPEKIYVKYSHADTKRIEKIEQGDWIDLSADEDVTLKEGEFKLISLGIAIKLPKGYEAHIAPRGSTFKNWGIFQPNSPGIVDESYSGDDDIIFFPAYATRDTTIERGNRICQFRIVKKMPEVKIIEVNLLTNPNRGGHGSTGV